MAASMCMDMCMEEKKEPRRSNFHGTGPRCSRSSSLERSVNLKFKVSANITTGCLAL